MFKFTEIGKVYFGATIGFIITFFMVAFFTQSGNTGLWMATVAIAIFFHGLWRKSLK